MITFKEYYMLEEAPTDLASGIQASRNNQQMINPNYPQGRVAGVPAGGTTTNATGGSQQIDFDTELQNVQNIQDPAQRQAALQDILNRMDQEIQKVSPALTAANKNAEQGLPAGDQEDLQNRNAYLSKTRYNTLNQMQQTAQPQTAAPQQAAQPQTTAPQQPTQPQTTAPQQATTAPVGNQQPGTTNRMAQLIQQRNNNKRNRVANPVAA